MAVTTEMLNTTLSDFTGPVEHTMEESVPLYDLIVKGGGIVNSVRGPLIERPIYGGSPVKGRGIFTGTETVPMSRTDQTHKIRVEPHRVVVGIPAPKRLMKISTGKAAVYDIVKEALDSVLKLWPRDLESFLFTGVSVGQVLDTTALSGWNTLYGGVTLASGLTGVTDGLLELDAPESQNSTIQDLLASETYGYVNQYGEVTTWASDGKTIAKRVARQAARWNQGRPGQGFDVYYLDPDTFELYEEAQDAKVQIQVTQQSTDKPGSISKIEQALGADNVVCAHAIDIAAFSGLAASGIGYGLSKAGLEWHWYQKPEVLPFEDLGRAYDQVAAKIEMMGAFVMRNRRAQGVIVGCARK